MGGGAWERSSRGGLPCADDPRGGVRGRGDIGTFQRLASSGNSSSESWYSASSSWTDLRLGCHEARLAGGANDDLGETAPGLRNDVVEMVGETKLATRRFGEEDRVRNWGAK